MCLNMHIYIQVEPIENKRRRMMTQRERGLMMKLAEELGKAKVRIEEIEKELEKLKENQYDLHSELKEVYRIVIE